MSLLSYFRRVRQEHRDEARDNAIMFLRHENERLRALCKWNQQNCCMCPNGEDQDDEDRMRKDAGRYRFLRLWVDDNPDHCSVDYFVHNPDLCKSRWSGDLSLETLDAYIDEKLLATDRTAEPGAPQGDA